MQHITSICDELKQITEDVFDSMDLDALVRRLRPLTAAQTMHYITTRDGELKDNNIQGSYSQRIRGKLTTIRNKYMNEAFKNERIRITGNVMPADSMCLFVCGLLPYPGMSFMQWVSSDQPAVTAYANAFFDYMMQASAAIYVQTTKPTSNDAELTRLQTDALTTPSPCFICAEELLLEDMLTLNDKKVLILDAFSYKNKDDAFSADDTFLQYHPVVWHLHCLYLFRADDTLCCYAAKTPGASYAFMGNYEKHFKTVKENSLTKTAPQAVLEMIVRPLEMYQRSLQTLGAPDAVISRSRHKEGWTYDITTYIPLTYAHMLVWQSIKPIYVDANFDDIEGMLAFVVARSQRIILNTLPYDPAQTNAFALPTDPPPNAYAQLAQTHHALMQTHAFVIPDRATEEEILFDKITPGGHSKHRDYIGALCTVRYNWVFDRTSRHADISAIRAPKPDALYHEIDVYRHIAHLNSSGTINASPFLKIMLTGGHVRETVGQKRAGVVVFDVQEHGRFHKYFKGHGHLNDSLRVAGLQTIQAPDDCWTTCTNFGIDASKTSNYCVVDAMKTYFNQQNKWSLCDMAYKYVVRTADDQYFVQDSFALNQDISKTTTTDTFARCPFCPVCFEDIQNGDQQSAMYYHIRDTEKDFPVANIAHVAQRPPSPRLPHLHEDLPSGSSDPSSSDPSDPSDSSDGGHSARSFDPERATQHTKRHDEFEALMLRLRRQIDLQKVATASDAQAEVAAWSHEALKKKYDKLKRDFDDLTKTAENSLNAFEENFKLLLANIHQETEDAKKEKVETATLQQQLKHQSEEHARKAKELTKEHEEKMAKVAKEHEDNVTKLLEDHSKKLQEHDDKHEESDKLKTAFEQQIADLEKQLQDNLKHNTDLAALTRESQARQDTIDRLTRDIQNLNAAHATALGALQDELDKLKSKPTPPAAPHDDAALHAALADVRRLQAELKTCTTNKQVLQRDISDLRQQISDMTRELKNTVATNQTRLTDLKQTISRNTQREISRSELMKLLLAQDYPAIRDAVQGRATQPRRVYSTAAVFLHLESMGATWKMYLANEAESQKTDDQKKKVMDRRFLVLEQMLYDLTLWFSMLNNVKTRYCSAHVTAFIHAFGLRNDETRDPNAEASSDEDA